MFGDPFRNQDLGDHQPDKMDRSSKQMPEGDGLHHHTIDEDEGGGFHSKHTHPDGNEDHADHADYDEAKMKMDSDFGHGEDDGEPDGDEEMPMEEGNSDDVAGAYGRKACG